MVLHPHCQAKAQEEIDMIVGSDRLPEFNDRSSLPYLECLLQETLRFAALIARLSVLLIFITLDGFQPLLMVWKPLFNTHNVIHKPLSGIPHQSMADDTYNGMFIPGGSVVIANAR